MPDQAREELELPGGGIALYDVSRALPRREHPRRKDVRPRGARIERIYVHHSGALGRGGWYGARNAVRYVVDKRDFPGAPYHFWVPHDEARDSTGRRVVFRLAEDEYRCWSQGDKANDHGISVCLQGNLVDGMSHHQEEVLEGLLPWLLSRHGLRQWLPMSLSYHAEAGRYGGRSKATCPPEAVRAWLDDYRRRAVDG